MNQSKPKKKRQREVIPRTPFVWNPQLKENEKKRYEKILAEKIRNHESWRDPEEIRENFIEGYVAKMNSCR